MLEYVEDELEAEIRRTITMLVKGYSIQEKIGIDELYDMLDDLVTKCINIHDEFEYDE